MSVSVASASDLGRLTVEQARESRRKIEIECSQKQEELRELVAVRYKDFIEAADTIAAMGGKAGEILKTSTPSSARKWISVNGKDSPCTRG